MTAARHACRFTPWHPLRPDLLWCVCGAIVFSEYRSDAHPTTVRAERAHYRHHDRRRALRRLSKRKG